MFALEGVSPDMARAGISLLVTSPGLVMSPFHFFSTGYGCSVAALAAHSLLSRKEAIAPAGLMQASLLGLFGARLGGFLFIRSYQESYQNRELMKELKKKMGSMSIFKRAMTWIPISLVYLLFVEPSQSTIVQNTTPLTNPFFIAGMATATAGFIIESVADSQKLALKKKEREAFCRTGLYSLVRHPNYLGEIMFWAGHLAAGLPALAGDWKRLAMAVVGAGVNLQMMLAASTRLDARQEDKYGRRQDWQEYRKSTACRLFPGIEGPPPAPK
mmetsp:Transcript_24371/g.58041  ORF Transcript_24371/g.58041 Transcript_24371/m.58041 type:complete len:272 (-) Transcript_24371:50-865(-)